ncbi:MAG: regulatory protein RecX [Ruthenibacterium sp.]
MKIARIQKTKQGRFSLFDDDDTFLFSVDGETLLREKISEGTEVSQQELAQLKAQSDTRKAKDKALCFLALRDYASGELYDKLCLKFDARTAAQAVAEMRRLDLLDDEKFALHRAKYLAGQNKSAREIQSHLMQKGVDRETACAAVQELSISGEDACYALLQKSYLRKLQNDETQKVLAALARRGFSYGDAKAAIERVRSELALAEDGACGDAPYDEC